MAMAAPQFYYPSVPTSVVHHPSSFINPTSSFQYVPSYETARVVQPAAPATPAVTLPATVPAAASNQADLNAQLAGLAALVPQLKSLSALSTAQSPAALSSLDAISGASLNLLNKVRTIRISCSHKCRESHALYNFFLF